MKKHILFAPILAAVIWSACSGNVVFEQKQELPAGRWQYADTLNFSFSIADTSALYNLYLGFEYTDSFPNQNLYLKLHTLFPDGKRQQKLRSFNLFDGAGAALGQCSGRRCNLPVMLQENAFFKLPGTYVISLEQFGRQDAVPGIEAVELKVERTEKKK